MYVGVPRYDRAFSMIVGFDAARGQSELAAFQEWMVGRHPAGRSSLVWWALVLVEVLGVDTPPSPSNLEDEQAAIGHLCRLLRAFFAEVGHQ